jgi:hypothetical protein
MKPSFWRSPTSRPSPRVVILAQPESPYLPLYVLVRHSGAARISVLALAFALALVCSIVCHSVAKRNLLLLLPLPVLARHSRTAPEVVIPAQPTIIVILAQPESLYLSCFPYAHGFNSAERRENAITDVPQVVPSAACRAR